MCSVVACVHPVLCVAVCVHPGVCTVHREVDKRGGAFFLRVSNKYMV